MLWLDKEKIKITNKLKAKYTEARHCILQLQIPLTTTERLQNWIKLGLWLILIAILFLLISLDWTVLASLYATVMTVIFWLKGWDQIASKLAQYWQKQRLEKEVIDSRLTTFIEYFDNNYRLAIPIARRSQSQVSACFGCHLSYSNRYTSYHHY